MSDKNIEAQRYSMKAAKMLKSNIDLKDFTGANRSVNPVFRSPYEKYISLVRSEVQGIHSVLEIGSGTGEFTGELLGTCASVFATDISSVALDVLAVRYSDFANLNIFVADMEQLPFSDGYFDVVCSSGSLSYGDNFKVLQEIYRVLKNGGVFICVDSLNNNPVYRLNRYISYIFGKRSKSTLINMPSLKLIDDYSLKFSSVSLFFFGAITYIAFPLSFLFGATLSARLSDLFDKLVGAKASSFKFIMIARK